MRFAKIDHDARMGRIGLPARSILDTIGLHVPLRVFVCEDGGGKGRIACDLSSTRMGRLDDAA